MAEFIEVSFDIVHNILSRVPAKYLVRFRCVCKAWKGIIDDQSLFVKSHIKNQQSSSSSTILIRNEEEEEGGALFCLSLDSLISRLPKLKINPPPRRDPLEDMIPLEQIILPGVPRLSNLPKPSCNGLILIPHNNIKESWAIWNPLLQDFHLLPPPLPETDLKSDKYESVLERCGFGYDEGSEDYKVVRVDRFYGLRVNGNNRTRVYSMKSLSWRTIYDFPGGDCLGDHGAFLDGALYWKSRDGVVALDLRSEVHRLVAPPPPSPNINKERGCESLEALDGCLIWSCIHQNLKGVEAWVMGTDYSWTELYSVEAWVMEADYSWTKLYSVETANARGLRIVGYLKSKGKVFFQHRGDGLRWLDIQNKSWKDISISRVFCSSISSTDIPTFSLSFTPISPLSLVRLDDHYKNTSGVKRKRKMEKAYTRSKKTRTAREACGGGGAYLVRHFGE